MNGGLNNHDALSSVGQLGMGGLGNSRVLFWLGVCGPLYCSSIRSTNLIESCEKMEQAIVVTNNKLNGSIFLSKSKINGKYVQ